MPYLLSRAALLLSLSLTPLAHAACPYDSDCLNNPYGAGNPYKADGLNNPYSPYGSPYSNKSWRNPYATDAPKLYDQNGNYRGRLSSNPYDADSTSNPYGRYGNPYSADSINNRSKQAVSIGHGPSRLLVDPDGTVLPSFANLPNLRA
jgi:hypothetical protein